MFLTKKNITLYPDPPHFVSAVIKRRLLAVTAPKKNQAVKLVYAWQRRYADLTRPDLILPFSFCFPCVGIQMD
jgi:hypothetical protein